MLNFSNPRSSPVLCLTYSPFSFSGFFHHKLKFSSFSELFALLFPVFRRGLPFGLKNQKAIVLLVSTGMIFFSPAPLMSLLLSLEFGLPSCARFFPFPFPCGSCPFLSPSLASLIEAFLSPFLGRDLSLLLQYSKRPTLLFDPAFFISFLWSHRKSTVLWDPVRPFSFVVPFSFGSVTSRKFLPFPEKGSG